MPVDWYLKSYYRGRNVVVRRKGKAPFDSVCEGGIGRGHISARLLRGRSVAPPLRIWRLHIVTEPELKYEYEGIVR